MRSHYRKPSGSPQHGSHAQLLAVRWTENLQNLRLRIARPQRLQGAWRLTADHRSLVLHWSRLLPVAAQSGSRQQDLA